MCTPDAYGNCNENTWLRDDDFAAAVQSIGAGYKLMVMDCCHSGTMCDFGSRYLNWQGQKAISIVGCRDAQESAGMGGGTKGGAFSKALSTSAHKLQGQEISIGKLFNQVLQESQSLIPAGHKQDLTILCAPGMSGPDQMKWPLIIPEGTELDPLVVIPAAPQPQPAARPAV